MVKTRASKLLRLNAGFGQKVRGAEGKLAALGRRKIAAGVNHQGQAGERFVLAQPIHHVESVAVGQADVENQQMGLEGEACVESLSERVRQLDLMLSRENTSPITRGQVAIVFDNQDARFFAGSAEDAGQFTQQRILLERLGNPACDSGGAARRSPGSCGVINAEQHDGSSGFGIQPAQQGQNLPAVHAVQGRIEQDGLDALVAAARVCSTVAASTTR